MKIKLSHGAGGKEMDDLIASFGFSKRADWKNCDDDSATIKIGNQHLAFTTDSFIVEPVFFPGADIGHLAFCGTVNDLAVMGAKPLGLSIGIVIEEGFALKDLKKIIRSIKILSEKTDIPVVTGDTKVMQRGKLDQIMINTSGVGITNTLLTKKIEPGDRIIISGGLGEHAVALLSKRFDYETSIISDSKPILDEIQSVRDYIKAAKDITRGGLSAVLHELCKRYKVGIWLNEKRIPRKDEVHQVTEMLGLNIYDLACEGKFVCVCSDNNADRVLGNLQKFDKDAAVIGAVTDDDKIVIQTALGKRVLPIPRGRIVPRIC